MTPRSQDGRLDSLLEAVLSDEIAPERLARYAADPTALAAEERARIEQALATSPALADQLRILQSFDVSTALAPEQPEAPPLRTPIRRAPPRRARWLRSFAPALAAAAAGFLVAIVFFQRPAPETLTGPRLAALERELAGAHEQVTGLASQLEQARRELAQRSADAASLAQRADRLEQQLADARAAEQASREELLALRGTAEEQATRIESLATRLEGKTDQLARAPAPIASPVDPTPPGPAPQGLGEPFQVALLSAFEVPNPGAPSLRSVLRSGSDPDLLSLEALAPEREGWTLAAQPTLYWRASRPSQLPVEFAIAREDDDALVAERALDPPREPGIQRIDLAALGVELERDRSYRWTVSLVVDPEDRSRDVIALAGVRRVSPPASVADLDASAPAAQRLDALERAGLWYDALDLVSRLIERHPDAQNLKARRRALLERAGL